MERAEPSVAWMVFAVALLVATAIGMWVTFLPIWVRAVRTGRLLGRGVTYDRDNNPIMYWLGFLSVLFFTLLITGMAFDGLCRIAWALTAPN